MIKSNYVCVFMHIYKNRENTRKSIRNSKDMFQIKFSFFQQILALKLFELVCPFLPTHLVRVVTAFLSNIIALHRQYYKVQPV